MAITTYEGLLETWAYEIETMEQSLENLYGPSTIPPVLPSVTTEDGMLEAVAEGTELAAWNFAKMYNYLSTETNTTRIADVPDTALFYGQLVKIGGNTVAESGELLSAEVTSVISKDADGNTLQAYPIPVEVREIEGYGWSAETAYNYIDFERKVFVQRTGSVDISTLSYARGVSSTSGLTYFDSTSLSAVKKRGTSNLVCAKFIRTPNNQAAPVGSPYGLMYGLGDYVTFYADYPDVYSFKAAMEGTYLFYELQTPIETDISQYLTDTDIKVKAGGTLTFDNSNNLDIPSEVRYIS